MISYLLGVCSLGATFYYTGQLGGDHPIPASFGAAVVFFVGAGIVLHVMGSVSLPDLSIKREDVGSSSGSEQDEGK
jgi:hypothetical protein